MHKKDKSALFAICSRLELESNNLRKIAEEKNIEGDEASMFEYYARRLDSLRWDIMRNFRAAFE